MLLARSSVAFHLADAPSPQRCAGHLARVQPRPVAGILWAALRRGGHRRDEKVVASSAAFIGRVPVAMPL